MISQSATFCHFLNLFFKMNLLFKIVFDLGKKCEDGRVPLYSTPSFSCY